MFSHFEALNEKNVSVDVELPEGDPSQPSHPVIKTRDILTGVQQPKDSDSDSHLQFSLCLTHQRR